ncbi:uncharacterized protein LOC119682198 [Teleopsis dalmanni]|uniref:uncharacterized protein LOC119682198 n=1 Tax=Teleopsis dalmanni TaxID=139649 RepID=UPI0018CEB669|nr:uncharacterized protein LOC119682198 [Teleopsis dalmanni]XP_037951494.1 uncharacterized protein LOC119682198 [Teleopsis dalmanni]XP_037951495.1 uncharacterized protein LOC119682198 [Teleopsis dalmanni]XP_037951496.1 uncharacterized protein LOC119682198 [Teleopsis dalmanni]
MLEQECKEEPHTEQEEDADAEAEAYLNHLLNDGCNEGDSGAEMEMPPWYNEQLFIRGQTFMSKYRFVLHSGMLAGLVAVLAIPSILRILICTRQSSTPATAYRRYLRTILHTNAWYDHSPTSKNSKFWTSLRAVRKAHSHSSKASTKLGSGQITQKDLALTQFGFIGFITLGAPRIQLYDEEFLECTSHMWRVLGYLLGIKDEYNICGENWSETKKRLNIVRQKVYVPALENTNEEFVQMTKALLEGLWPVNTTLTVGSFLFFTKRLAYVKGYEYYEFDQEPGTKRDPDQKKYFYDLNWWDRIIVSYGLHVVTYFHKYNIVRCYLNFRVWLSQLIVYYLPYVAIWKYGFKSAYVRIFTHSGKEKEFQFHLKTD